MTGKIILDIAKKAFPGAPKKVQNTFKKLYDEMRINMSKDSAFEQAKKETREAHKDIYKKSLGGLMSKNDYYKDIL